MRMCGYSRGFAGEGASNESGSSKMVIFASFACYIFRTFMSKATIIVLCVPLVAAH